MVARSWDRLLWGIEFSSPGEKPMLIGTLWMHPIGKPNHNDEPTRPILFCTRSSARKWCKERMAIYAEREDFVSSWRFSPVRVRETVMIADAATKLGVTIK